MPYKLKENYQLNLEKIQDVMNCYKEVAPTCLTQHGAWVKIAEHPAKRFYISPKAAYSRISRFLSGDYNAIYSIQSKLKRDMYIELIEVVKLLLNRPEFYGRTLHYVIKYAVEQPASKFFLTPKGIRNLFQYGKYGKYDSDGKILR